MTGPPHQVLMTTSHWICALVITLTMMGTVDSQCPVSPTSCSCEWNKNQQFIVNCRYESLATIPSWINSTTRIYEVTLANNKIKILDASAFKGVKMTRLDLFGNAITSIDPNAFSGLEDSLEQLLIQVNGITTFPKAAIARLVNLKLLVINGLDVPSLGKDALMTLTNLKTLQLSRCGLREMIYSEIAGPKDSITHLNLRHNRFQNIGQASISQLKNLVSLDFAHNRIAELPNSMFLHNPNIKNLEFSNNQLNTIKPTAFQGIEASLTQLNLQSNKLTANQLEPFKVLSGINKVNLDNNQLTSIHKNAFQNAHKLHTLSLRSNKLKELKKLPFEGITGNLATLELRNNQLEDIESGFFGAFKVLNALDMSGQPLHEVINMDTFDGLEKVLNSLVLMECSLMFSDLNIFSNLTNLELLNLDTNLITEIPDWTFSKLSKLASLDLAFNSITTLTALSVVGMQKSLTDINMMGNRIETLSVCTFSGFNALTQIQLANNPLKCDCEMVWLVQWIAKHDIDYRKLLISWTCTSPPSLSDVMFNNLTERQICPAGHNKVKCEQPIITTLAPAPTVTTKIYNEDELVNVTSISHNSVMLYWKKWRTDILYYEIKLNKRFNISVIRHEQIPATHNYYKLQYLDPSTMYRVCLITVYMSMENDFKCDYFSTISIPKARTEGNNIGVIAGATVGVVVFVAMLLSAVMLVRARGDVALQNMFPKSRPHSTLPFPGTGSRRFSRPSRAGVTASQLNCPNNRIQSKTSIQSPDSDWLSSPISSDSGKFSERVSTFSGTSNVSGISGLTALSGNSGRSGMSNGSRVSAQSGEQYPNLPPRPANLVPSAYMKPANKLSDDEEHEYAEIPYYSTNASGATNFYEEPISTVQRRKSIESSNSAKYENPTFHSSTDDVTNHI